MRTRAVMVGDRFRHRFGLRAASMVGAAAMTLIAGVALAAPASASTIPDAPVASASITAADAIHLSWTTPADGGSAITGYHIDYSVNSDMTSATGVDVGVVNTYDITGLSASTTYYAWVAATNFDGTSLASTTVSAAVVGLPGAPSITSATPGDRRVPLVWTAADANGGTITQYWVRAYDSLGNLVLDHATGSASTQGGVGLNLVNGTIYKFTVAAQNEVGKGQESTVSSLYTPDIAPTAPSNVRAVAKRGGQANVIFGKPRSTSSSAPVLYTAYAYDNSNSEVGTCSTSPSATLGCQISGLTKGSSYTFKVKVKNQSAMWSPLSGASAPVVAK